ncbi:hypothetical protein EON80_01250 [bacterium]|nr:MAG: hypothetical protein EON80_01250 [bacterium]
MPFLRPGQVAAFASPIPKINQLGLLTLFSLSAAVSASARPAKISKTSRTTRVSKPIGVNAWTSGSQTYIRSRPGANVPPVAKVARHTKLFVWGKYNGWYRVETPDHIFGWVFNEYLNSPGLDKVPEMGKTQAKLASKRTDGQLMFGTPAQLKKHYISYGSKGALEGLKMQGVYLAVAPKPSAKPKTLIASSKDGVKPVVVKAKPRIAAVPHVRERVVAQPAAPRVITPRKPPEAVKAPAPVEVSPVPAVENPDDLAPVTAVAPIPEENTADAGRIAGAARGGASSARMFARAATAAATQPEVASPRTAAPVAVAPVKTVVTQPVVSRPAVVKPVARPVAAKPPVKKVAAKPKVVKKPVAKAKPASRYVTARARKREQLRVQMGLSPKSSPPSVIAPVSPMELMKAREEYLNSRKARLGTQAPVNTTSPESPTIGIAPLPTPSGPLGGPSGNALSPAPPAEISPTAFEGGVAPLPTLAFNDGAHPLAPLMNAPEVLALAQMKPKAPAATKTAPLSARGGAMRGGSPRDRVAPDRGGSPRDRVGKGMATQALSYRGMPYIRGAASPSRGFDCSGLIYFLLRQRGYNPPRTAAGYKNWGTAVPRGQWKAGDLVLFSNTYKRGISHIGVYLGEGKFVHAATTRTGVRVSSLNEAYYAKKYSGARRIK